MLTCGSRQSGSERRVCFTQKMDLEDCGSSCRSDNDGSAGRFGIPPINSVAVWESGSISQTLAAAARDAQGLLPFPVALSRHTRSPGRPAKSQAFRALAKAGPRCIKKDGGQFGTSRGCALKSRIYRPRPTPNYPRSLRNKSRALNRSERTSTKRAVP